MSGPAECITRSQRCFASDQREAVNSPSGFEVRTADWLSVGDAQRRVFGQATALPGEWIPLSSAWGRALAEDMVAAVTLPPWDNAAMDGYAVRGQDVAGASPASPRTLDVTGIVRAGGPPSPILDEGTAVRIMTGAPVPDRKSVV